MMATKFPDEPQDILDMAKEIQALAKGEPLTREKVESHYERYDDWHKVQYAVWNVRTPAVVYDLITIVIRSISSDVDIDAIKNALGFLYVSAEPANLTARRMAYLEHENVTARSLQEREIRGARKLAHQIKIMQRSRPEIFVVQDLGRRVEELERQMRQLMRERGVGS